MIVLALDGALGAFSIALDEGATVAERVAPPAAALESGIDLARELLGAEGLARVDRIAVGLGPGGFTGLRIALTYAKAIAFARDLPLVGVSSYDVIDDGSEAGPVLAVVVGRPGIYSARLRNADGTTAAASGPVGDIVALLPEHAEAPQTLTVIAPTEDVSRACAERGFIVRTLPPPAAPAARIIAARARTAVPYAFAHAAVPDYGERPAVTTPKPRA